MTGRTSKNSKKTEVGKSASASAKAKKKGANGAKVSKYNEKSKMLEPKISDVQRIEALEAVVDELQSNFFSLKKSLVELLEIGIENPEIKQILSSSIDGEVTGIEGGKIVGWVANKVDQLSLIPVSVYYGGNKIASTLANKSLTEEMMKKSSSGKSFSIILPKQFYDGRTRSLQFKAGEVEADLKNIVGPISFDDGFPLEGSASVDNNGVIKGWAIDLGEPKTPIIVSAHYGEREVARTLADLNEKTLASRFGKTNCHHGFSLELPSNLGDGKKRNIRLVASSWGYDILESPIECKFSRR